MNDNQYPQDTSVNPKVSSILGTWQNLQIILGQQVQRYIQSVNTKNQNNRRGVSISDINGLLSFLESTINNTLSVTLNQKISISKLKTQQNTMNESNNGKKQTIRLNESQLRQIVSESVKRILKEWEEPDYAANGKYYVAADSNSDYFDDYNEAYNYALKLANNERKRFPDDWEEIHLMDNEEWQSIVIFNETGIHDLENGTFIPWRD